MSAAQTKRILLVDDSQDTLDALAAILRRRGYEVACAASPHAALACVERCCFDVVVTDLKMPDMDGLEFVRRLKPLAPQTRVVLTTVYANEYNRTDGDAAGVDAYFIKPFDPTLFLQTIAELSEP
jgi:CheY-like chemotaxis protein